MPLFPPRLGTLMGPADPPVATPPIAITPTTAPPGVSGFFNRASSNAGHYGHPGPIINRPELLQRHFDAVRGFFAGRGHG